ncbi:MAG: hypothetical protein HQK96_21325 [Nitrospirae bacterium]|nr:hypothetical protein [Nitrospirota bacterium]
MANIIESLGYSLGKVHIGMIAYACDLYRGGQLDPLKTILEKLKVKVPKIPTAKREWKLSKGIRVDLAIFDGKSEKPSIIIEMKVDDHEKDVKIDGMYIPQTKAYAEAAPEDTDRLFITLGHGEYYHPPRDDSIRWVQLSDFANSVETAAKSSNLPWVQDWASALKNELYRRNEVTNNIRNNLELFRSGSWNIIFLGLLKDSLLESSAVKALDFDPRCYAYGTRPDTILNFSWDGCARYAEINNNGKLNLKINLDECVDDKKREAIYHNTKEHLQNRLGVSDDKIIKCSLSQGSATIASLDIGLATDKNALQYENDKGKNYTVSLLTKYLTALYSKKVLNK